MYTIDQFNNPFEAIKEFENQISKYTGAPYAIATDCCTHALEISFRLNIPQTTVKIPCRTYLSVLMTLHKLNIEYELDDIDWNGGYQILGTNIWDMARCLEENMYCSESIQCLSFGRTKPLEIGRGGMILTDNKDFAEAASKMRYDGRDVFAFSPWIDQKEFNVGYHYYMRPEEAVEGLNKLNTKTFTIQDKKFYNYPDCRKIIIRP
jgi:dTDP-4-amino-4,6-dideoxygalactose transaminase